MSAVTTAKPGGAEAVQLTFPGQFSRAYKLRRLGERYAGVAEPVAKKQLYVGDDLMADIHRERRAEAHQMVMARVQATKDAEKRALVSHAGYYKMPAPVLSQRRVGSNFGVGGGFNGAFRDEASLVGGVIGTPEGRAWVQDALRRRKAELDALDANEFGMPLSGAVSKGVPPESFGELSRLELVSFLDQLLAQASGGRVEFSPDTFRRFFALLVRFATIAEKEELDDVYNRIDEVLGVLEAKAGGRYDQEDDESELGKSAAAFLQVLGKLLLAARTYVKIMYGGVTLSERDRRTLSRSALRDAGFIQLNRDFAKAGVEELLPTSLDEAERASTGAIYRGDRDDEDRMRVRLGRDIYGSATFSRAGESAEISNGPAFVASTEPWSNTPRDIIGRQGESELRGDRVYANESGSNARQRQGAQDYEAEALEQGGAPSRFEQSLSMLAQPTEAEDIEGQEAVERGIAPPLGEDYFATWTAQGYTSLEGTPVGEFLKREIQSPADIYAYLDSFRGQFANTVELANLVNVMREARGVKGAKRLTGASSLSYLKKLAKDELEELFSVEDFQQRFGRTQ